MNKTSDDDDIVFIVEDTIICRCISKESATRRQTQLFTVNLLYFLSIVLTMLYYAFASLSCTSMCHSARHEDCNKLLRKGGFLLFLCSFTYQPQFTVLDWTVLFISQGYRDVRFKNTVIVGLNLVVNVECCCWLLLVVASCC